MTALPEDLAALERLEWALASLYRVDTPPPLAPFVIGEEVLARMAGTGAIQPRPGAREEVFILDDGHEVSVAVYLDTAARGAARDALRGPELLLEAAGFADFCVALEGVSHFLLVTHRAQAGQPVTQLELELQAEVDKYILARLSPWAQPEGRGPGLADWDWPAAGPPAHAVVTALFHNFHLADHLHADQAERYATASRLAQRYCRRLERSFLSARRGQALADDLRRFFRKSQAGRLEHIGGA